MLSSIFEKASRVVWHDVLSVISRFGPNNTVFFR